MRSPAAPTATHAALMGTQENKPAAAPTRQPPRWEMWGWGRQRFGSQKVNQLLWHCSSCRDSAGFPKLCVWLGQGNISSEAHGRVSTAAGVAPLHHGWALVCRGNVRASEPLCPGSLQPDLPIHQPQLAPLSPCLFSKG